MSLSVDGLDRGVALDRQIADVFHDLGDRNRRRLSSGPNFIRRNRRAPGRDADDESRASNDERNPHDDPPMLLFMRGRVRDIA